MTDSRRRAMARLAHDVGKYVARTARNLPPGDPPPVLVGMLVRDLYALEGGRRASALLAERLAEADLGGEPALARCGALLAEVDRIEHEVRAGSPAAVRRAAEVALEVERLLREAASRLGGPR